MTDPTTPNAVTGRLRRASELADLRPAHRLDSKVDMSPTGISRRLRAVAKLERLGRALGRARDGSESEPED